MKTNRKINPLLVLLISAVLAVLITVLIIFLLGYKYKTLDNDAKFIGQYENGVPVSGTLKYTNGLEATLDYYTQTITYNNGDKYVGGIVNGCRHGHGVMYFSATGDCYEGNFDTDIISGEGTYTYSNGDIFEGTFVNSQKHGYGVFTYSNGNKYEGYYENDVRHGEGRFSWASGAYYVGQFANNLKNGEGVMTYENGDVYEGGFKDDMRHGDNCTYYYAEKHEVYNGSYRNNLSDTRLMDENGNFVLDENGEYVHGEKASYQFDMTNEKSRVFTGYFVEGKPVGITIG